MSLEKYDNNNNLKVYLAGPFFNDEQIERISFLENLLEKNGFDVFSPRKASLLKGDSSLEKMKKTFDNNISSIDECDFVLAVLDTEKENKYSDSGTIFEAGYAYSKNKPILYFNENRNKGANLMLAMSGKLPYITKINTISDIFDLKFENIIKSRYKSIIKIEPRKNLDIILKYIKDNGLEKIIKYTKFYQRGIE